MICDFNCDLFNKYRVELPYPPVHINKPNLCYAALISGAYAGRGSELTAIAQYTFHNHYTNDYPDIFTAIKYITIVETIHLDLLGNLIKQLGIIPEYISCETNTYWSGCFPDKSTEIIKMLSADILGEKEAIAHYERLISQIRDESINNLFRRIIMDEKKHLEILVPLRDSLK